ncbi:MAG: glycosyltransferase family 2 protein [Thermoanaerobaculia bacterium]
MSDLAIVLVHYRTPALLVGAVQALRRDLESSHLDAEILVIDNGSDPADRKAWGGLRVRRIDPGANLGYAGGVRCGVEATTAGRIVAMNPDVLVLEGCLGHLAAELERGAAAAGPQFFWDRQRRLFLPPTERRSATAELRAAAARSFPPAFAGAARRAWRRHARRHWEATAPFSSPSLSGALLAFRRDAWMKIGPFDDAFHLYFEETDWLLRLGAAGLASRFVPAAEAVHLFAQSSVQEPRATAWFAEGERLFRRRHYGAGVANLLDMLSAGPALRALRSHRSHRSHFGADSPRWSESEPALALGELSTPRSPAWVEVALTAAGFPAAGERLVAPARDWQMVDEVWGRLPPGELWIRGVDSAGRESIPVRLARSTPTAAA